MQGGRTILTGSERWTKSDWKTRRHRNRKRDRYRGREGEEEINNEKERIEREMQKKKRLLLIRGFPIDKRFGILSAILTVLILRTNPANIVQCRFPFDVFFPPFYICIISFASPIYTHHLFLKSHFPTYPVRDTRKRTF